jgi:TFIIF-interacting CTD phosphatase-like protein
MAQDYVSSENVDPNSLMTRESGKSGESKLSQIPPITPPREKLTLVLDMDETLLHFNHNRRFYRPRPHVHDFLREMSQYYVLIVFTAGMKDYADFLLDDLDRDRLISRRLYRGSCTF